MLGAWARDALDGGVWDPKYLIPAQSATISGSRASFSNTMPPNPSQKWPRPIFNLVLFGGLVKYFREAVAGAGARVIKAGLVLEANHLQAAAQ
jgi:hypothetical protein